MEQSASHATPLEIQQELSRLREAVRQQALHIARLEATVKEVFEVSLLPEAERQVRAVEYRKHRLARLRQLLDQACSVGAFERLEPLLHELQHSFKDDAEAEEVRLQAWARRDAALAEAIATLQDRTRALASIGQWSQSIDLVDVALKRFPDQTELLNLRSQIEREHHAWRDETAGRLFAQIKDAIDRREWRRALRDAEEMAGRFSDHPRGAKIVQQLATIRDNAQIEQRQEMEQSLQQLVRAGRFDDAIALAEQIIRHYPLSPQAAECRTLVVKLQELAMHAETENRQSQ